VNILSHALASTPILLAASETGVIGVHDWETLAVFGFVAIAPDISGLWSKSLSGHHGTPSIHQYSGLLLP